MGLTELAVRELSVSYGAVRALDGVDVKVRSGEAVVVAGANGSGKTTLLRAVAGLVPVEGGRVVWDGTDVTGWPPWRRSRLGLVYGPERARVAPDMSVYENLVVGAWATGKTDTLDDVFALFPALAAKRRQKAGHLSGGERQLLIVGRALMARPRCLLLDEPFAGLSPATGEILATLLRKVRQRGAAVLISEHDPAYAGRVADRIYGLAGGHRVFEGTVDEFREPGIQERIYA